MKFEYLLSCRGTFATGSGPIVTQRKRVGVLCQEMVAGFFVRRHSTQGTQMTSQTSTVSMDPRQASRFHQMTWQDIRDPGAYVEVGSGDLYRIPKEALLEGSSPMIRKESSGSSTLLQISHNPYVTTFEARMVCAEHNV